MLCGMYLRGIRGESWCIKYTQISKSSTEAHKTMLFSPVYSSPQDAIPFHGYIPFRLMGTVLFTHPKDYRSTQGLPIEQFTEVRFHFAGPIMRYTHGGRGVLPIPIRTAERIEYSWNAYDRRRREHGQDPLLLPPTVPMEGVVINLCYVDTWVKTAEVANQGQFMYYLQLFTPDKVKGDEEHSVLEWDIVCPHCKEAIPHYASDEYWNGRYLDHRRHSQCKKQELKHVAKPSASSNTLSGPGVPGGRT